MQIGLDQQNVGECNGLFRCASSECQGSHEVESSLETPSIDKEETVSKNVPKNECLPLLVLRADSRMYARLQRQAGVGSVLLVGKRRPT